MSKNSKVQNKAKNELIVEGLLGKIAYSSKLLEDQSTATKLSKLMGNKIFQKAMMAMFPESAQESHNFHGSEIEYIESDVEFRD